VHAAIHSWHDLFVGGKARPCGVVGRPHRRLLLVALERRCSGRELAGKGVPGRRRSRVLRFTVARHRVLQPAVRAELPEPRRRPPRPE